MKKIHPTQKKLLELLKKSRQESYTMRELQDLLNLSSTSVVHHHIQQLEKKGLLKRNPNNPSDYQIIEEGDDSLIYLNLYGLARCGPKGRILDGNPIDRIPISTKFFSGPAEQAFLIKAAGDSMLPKIHDGDLVIAVKSQLAEHGQVVVCVNKGEALIKKLIKKPDAYYLESFNPAYPPFRIDHSDFMIEGIVKSLISCSLE